MKGTGAAATLTLGWGCMTLGACQLVGGITDRTLAVTNGDATRPTLRSASPPETTAAALRPTGWRRGWGHR